MLLTTELTDRDKGVIKRAWGLYSVYNLNPNTPKRGQDICVIGNTPDGKRILGLRYEPKMIKLKQPNSYNISNIDYIICTQSQGLSTVELKLSGGDLLDALLKNRVAGLSIYRQSLVLTKILFRVEDIPCA